MRVSALPVLLVAAALLAGGCSRAIEGNGSIAEGIVTPAPTSPAEPGPDGSAGPDRSAGATQSAAPTGTTAPAPTPTTDRTLVRERLLCVLERASITSINSEFNKSKNRDAQIRVLRTGAATISGHLSRSGLPAGDRIREPGQGVLDQLTKLVRDASGGGTPSTAPYNRATGRFQQACGAL
ncbi:MAG: hypothetical protein ACJ73E_06040 [Mycobacteriales bacterium]